MPTKSRRPWRKRASTLLLAGLAACSARDAGPESRVALEQELVIRESGDSVLFNEQSRLASIRGGILVSGVLGGRTLAFYDSAGALVRIQGTRGKGPGEYAEAASVGLGPGDSIWVGDLQNGRLSVLSPEGVFVRTVPAERQEAHFTATPDGRLLGNGMTFSRERGRREYHLRRVTWDGRTVTPIASSIPFGRMGRFAPADSGRVWVAEKGMYTVRLFDGDRLIRTLDQTRAWFPTDTTPDRTLGGRPFIAGMNVEGSVLWVFIRRPTPSWKAGRPSSRPIRPSQLPPLGEVFVGTLEALDARSGRLIASVDTPGDLMEFIGPGRLYQLTPDASGALEFRIVRARLERHD